MCNEASFQARFDEAAQVAEGRRRRGIRSRAAHEGQAGQVQQPLANLRVSRVTTKGQFKL